MREILKTEDEWLAKRRTVVTATEAASLIGLNKYKSPAKVAKEKEGPSTFFGNMYTKVGQLLEPTVIDLTNNVLNTNYKLLESPKGKPFYTHNKVKLGATPDAIEGDKFLECKTTKPLNFKKYMYSPPQYYVVQLIVQMMCANKTSGHLAIMSTDLSPSGFNSNWPITIFEVVPHERICELIEQEVDRFWELKDQGKTMRVATEVKRQAQLLIPLSYKKVY